MITNAHNKLTRR